MLPLSVYQSRRDKLRTLLPQGLVVLGGHRQLPLNLLMNQTRRRQGSHILFLTGLQETEAVILLHLGSGRLEIFVPAPAPDDAIWHGESLSLKELADSIGADEAYPREQLEERIRHHTATGGGPIYTLPSADPAWPATMAAIGVEVPDFGKLDRFAPNPLADAMIKLRLAQDAPGLDEMRKAAAINARAFRTAMAATRVGGGEAQIRALMEAVFTASGVGTSFDSIVTIKGEILHCRANPYRLEDGQLLLVDVGCETKEGYASDVSRTWPVNGKFTERQRRVYEIVLAAEEGCISKVVAGAENRDIHLHAARVIAEGLRELGILRGSTDDLVENGAHSLFFPHGIGHLLGLDGHDLEDLGDRAGYLPDRKRSESFGLANLRLDRPLEPGMVVTTEPGIYFIPGLLENAEMEQRFGQWIDFAKAREYLGFGGIRIEDDVLTTEGAPEVLTRAIPKSVAEVEALVGSKPELLGVLEELRPLHPDA